MSIEDTLTVDDTIDLDLLIERQVRTLMVRGDAVSEIETRTWREIQDRLRNTRTELLRDQGAEA